MVRKAQSSISGGRRQGTGRGLGLGASMPSPLVAGPSASAPRSPAPGPSASAPQPPAPDTSASTPPPSVTGLSASVPRPLALGTSASAPPVIMDSTSTPPPPLAGPQPDDVVSQHEGEANKYTSRSISFATHQLRLEKVLKRLPTFQEVFNETHKKKGSDQYISDKAREVAETYSRHMSDKYGEESQQPLIDPDVWVAASGAPKEGHVYDFGHNLDTSKVISSCSSSASHATSPFTTPDTAALDDVTGFIRDEVSFLETRLYSKLSQTVSQAVTQAISQLISQTVSQAISQALSQSHFQAGIPSHRSPSTGAQPPHVPSSSGVEGDEDNDEDMGVQDL